MNTQAESRRQDRKARLEALGLSHPDDAFYGRTTDLAGVGRLTKADVREGRLQVEIQAGGVTFYLDTTNLRCADELFNLRSLDLGSRVALSGCLRSLGPRGVRLGRLSVLPTEAPFERVVFRPNTRAQGFIRLGEGEIKDPDPTATAFGFTPAAGTVGIHPLQEN